MALQLVRKSDSFCAGIFGLKLALWDKTVFELNQDIFLLFAQQAFLDLRRKCGDIHTKKAEAKTA